MPIILGNEASGVVLAVGDNVENVKAGDRVGYCGVGSNFFVTPAPMRKSEMCRRIDW
jgi:NADPH:quinone reductase-like Zn-dependent oxidoreductase